MSQQQDHVLETLSLSNNAGQDKTILIFDSGMGGLTVYQAIREQLPQSRYIYAFDNAGFPYGDKEDDVVIQRVNALIEKISQNETIDLVVIACNTASTIVLPRLRERFTIPIVGVVPAIKPAVQLTQNKIIGLLATKATLQRAYTQNLIQEYAPMCDVKLLGIPELAIIAEKKQQGDTVDLELLRELLKPWLVLSEVPDTIVLGCTHYPLIKEELKLLFPARTQFIDSGMAIANRVFYLLNKAQSNHHKNHQEQLSSIAYCTQYNSHVEKVRDVLYKNGFVQLEECQIDVP